jgi:uncharacterized protein DUF3592
MRPEDVVSHVLPPLGVLAGVGFVAIGAHVIRTGRRLRTYGRRVPGVVVRLRFDPNEHGGGQYYPVLRFQTHDGDTVETESDLGTNPAPVRPGQQVAVVYDPAKPRRARLDTMLGGGAVHGPLFIAFGVVVALIAAAVTFFVLT